jgi:dTDP-4-dehydrorhamnose 3,5-epimerase
VLRGRVLDVAVDVRRGSPRFGRWVQVELSRDNARMVLIPEGFAHGFYVLDDADFLYKCSDHYRPATERGILWSDPTLAITWPDAVPLLSPKDMRLPNLDDIGDQDLPSYSEPGRSVH